MLNERIQVEHAVADAIPFVAKAGGHSLWSTIGSEGFILDLSLLKAINVNTESGTANLEAAVSTQEALDAVSRKGFAIGEYLTRNTFPYLLVKVSISYR